MDCSSQAPLFMGFSRQEYWSGLPFPSPRWSALFCTQWIPQSLLLKPGSVNFDYFFLKKPLMNKASDNPHTYKFSGQKNQHFFFLRKFRSACVLWSRRESATIARKWNDHEFSQIQSRCIHFMEQFKTSCYTWYQNYWCKRLPVTSGVSVIHPRWSAELKLWF